jgi:hypothetical protein
VDGHSRGEGSTEDKQESMEKSETKEEERWVIEER